VDVPSGEPAPSEPSVFDAIDLDVALSVPSNLVLRGRDIRTGAAPVSLGDINLTVGGKLQARKAPAEPLRLIGDINTVRGTYTFQGRRFEVARDGRIGFSGGEEIDPLLDIQAQRTISGVETFVRVRGTMKKPEIAFSSNPPLEDADILSLIVFNQPVNELGEGEQVSLARRAGALASGYLTSNLTKSIGNALELDEFEIQALDDTGSPSVRIGEQVGRNLFFLVRQAFGTEQTTELILEYQIAEYLRLQATGAQGAVATERVQFRRVERAGLDLLFSFTY
jgi:translocation and assembly module TamB